MNFGLEQHNSESVGETTGEENLKNKNNATFVETNKKQGEAKKP